jgi:hypothetical protein
MLVAILIGIVVLVSGCRRRGRTLQEWAATPIEVSLTPVEPYAETKKLVLRVRNTSQGKVRVHRIALLQVGRISTHMTTAYQPLSDASYVAWSLASGQERTFTFDLRRIKFSSLDGRFDRAEVFADEIPESDRQFSVGVLHRSRMWSGGYENIVYYP